MDKDNPRAGGETGSRSESEPRLSMFQNIQSDIERISKKSAPTLAERERYTDLVESRNGLLKSASEKGFLRDVKSRLDDVSKTILKQPDIDQYVEGLEKLGVTYEKRAANGPKAKLYDERTYAGIVDWYYRTGLERVRYEATKIKDPAVKTDADEDFYQPRSENEYHPDPALFEKPEPARTHTGGRPSGVGGGSGELSQEEKAELRSFYESMTLEEQMDYMRDRLAWIRNNGYTYSQLVTIRNPKAEELTWLIASARREVHEEFKLRTTLQLVGHAMREAKGAGDAIGLAGNINIQDLQALFRLKVDGQAVISEAFRYFEQNGKVYASSTLDDRDKMKRRFGWRLAGITNDGELDRLAGDSSKLPHEYWAVLDAEDLWYLTNRAAFFGDKTFFFGERVINVRKSVVLDRDGSLFFRRNILSQDDLETIEQNDPNDLELQRRPGDIRYLRDERGKLTLDSTGRPQEDYESGGAQYINPYVEDLFTENARKLNIAGVIEDSWSGNPVPFTSLADVRFEDLQFVTELRGPELSLYWDKVNKADPIRDFLKGPTGFLAEPTPEHLEEGLTKGKLFEHLKGDKKDKAICNYLEASFEYIVDHYEGLPHLGPRSIAQQEHRNWEAKTREDIDQYIEIFINKGYISRDSEATKDLKERYGLPIGIKKEFHSYELGKLPGTVGGAVLSGLGEGLKIFVGALIGGGGKRH